MTKISHKKLVTKMGLNKGNILRVIAGDDLVINIEEEKCASMRRGVNKQRGIMGARGETSSSHHKGETLKPDARACFRP
jgi:hypothetical protein